MKTFVQDHNRDLALPAFTNVMTAHRNINEGNKAHIHSMQDSRPVRSWGSLHICPWLSKLSLHKEGHLQLYRRCMSLSDHSGRCGSSNKLSEEETEVDPLAIVMYTYCPENHLGHLFWSQYDYECFSDLLAFDSTYRKNLYNLPLVMFSGTNHHRQTILFGFELLEDEKILSYKWLLDTFLEVMHQKQPKVVVTDGDESMKEAIRVDFPNATHRLYAWHLAWNAISNIKDNDFCDAFKTAMYGHFEVEEID
ncbi:protein FAR1-RELATED SEQUENCE 5-like [Arachis ipaensis]|uniref:protein FAR1-RELATED SEQUENCE 5-like n=1 Tax=Arachis ipaensis TaxID=130454 RepID=UPI0007AF47DA|nr:protein FAR1-RELATED SEQUENCE 5-like [Arachis ipaensis]XP_025685409.1 protein FAR1-RELATED SEQUENCE 5-like [Arachis hypogaea]